MMTDTISDLLIQIKNGYMARRENITVPYSRLKENLVNLLAKEGYLGKHQIKNDGKVKKLMIINLIYIGKKPKLTEVLRVSKISRRVYVKKDKVPKVLGGMGVTILSNSAGLMSDKDARKKGLGGEIVCKVW